MMRICLLSTASLLALAYPALSQPADLSSANVLATGASLARTNAAISADRSNVLGQTGADPTGVADSTAAFNAAAALGKTVYVPSGTYHIKDSVNLASVGLVCDSRTNTTITVGSDFSSSALGVFVLTGNEQSAPTISGCTISFTQPADLVTTATGSTTNTVTVSNVTGIVVNDYITDATTSAAIPPLTQVQSIAGNILTLTKSGVTASNADSLHFSPSRTNFATLASGCTTTAGGTGCQYPWAVYYNGANRVRVDSLRIGGAWNGIYAVGGGGTNISNVEMGALNQGLDIDNVQDFAHLRSYHFWDFGFSGTGLGTGIFQDGSALAMSAGRVDGFDISGFTTWQGNIQITSNAANSQDAWAMNNVIVDDGVMTIAGSYKLSISNISFVCSSPYPCSTSNIINQSAGTVYIQTPIVATTGTVPAISVSGGALVTSNGYLSNDGAGAVANISAGILSVGQSSVLTHNASQSVPLISQSGSGTIELRGIDFTSSNASGTALSIGAFNSGNYLSNIKWSTLSFLQPGGVAGSTTGNMLFSTPGTYTYYPTPGVKNIRIIDAGGGGGGGGGALTASGTAASGGCGGGGSTWLDNTYRAIDLSSSLAVTVGAGGSVGAASTTNSTGGGAGGQGGESQVTGGIPASYSFGGGGGVGGQISAGCGGGAGASFYTVGGNGSGATGGTAGAYAGTGGSAAQAATNSTPQVGTGGGGSSAAGAAFHGGTQFNGGAGGSAGGGITTAPASTNGAPGVCPAVVSSSSPAGGTSGTPLGASIVPALAYQMGCSGGGGYGNASGNAGGGGASNQGAGGSGGGSALNGSTAGAGSAGGNGFVFIVEQY